MFGSDRYRFEFGRVEIKRAVVAKEPQVVFEKRVDVAGAGIDMLFAAFFAGFVPGSVPGRGFESAGSALGPLISFP